MSGTREDLARLLRQRIEMGVGELVVAPGSREELMRAVRMLAARGDDGGHADAPAASATQSTPEGTASGSRTDASRPAPRTAGERAAAAASRPTSDDAPAEESAVDDVAARIPSMDYDSLRETALGCTRCGLHETRRNVVFADGNPDARLVVVGEAPGANEDKTGLPFVGAAGKLLDLMLRSVDLSREQSVYICNVIKCRPPGNRNPEPVEIRTCSPFLKRQLELVKPEALLAVGTFAAQLLTGRDSALGKLRGEVHSYEGIPLVVTYHPAALLRNSGWVRPTWDDLQLLRGILDDA